MPQRVNHAEGAGRSASHPSPHTHVRVRHATLRGTRWPKLVLNRAIAAAQLSRASAGRYLAPARRAAPGCRASGRRAFPALARTRQPRRREPHGGFRARRCRARAVRHGPPTRRRSREPDAARGSGRAVPVHGGAALPAATPRDARREARDPTDVEPGPCSWPPPSPSSRSRVGPPACSTRWSTRSWRSWSPTTGRPWPSTSSPSSSAPKLPSPPPPPRPRPGGSSPRTPRSRCCSPCSPRCSCAPSSCSDARGPRWRSRASSSRWRSRPRTTGSTSGLSHDGRGLSAEELTERRQMGSVSAIKEANYALLGVAERALAPHTVALLWLDATDRWLEVKELRSPFRPGGRGAHRRRRGLLRGRDRRGASPWC